MAIGWKVLIPVSLVWIVLVGAVRVLRNAEGFTTTEVLLWVGIPLAVLLILAIAWPGKTGRRRGGRARRGGPARAGHRRRRRTPRVVAESRGRYPIPPMDLQVPIPPIRIARAEQERAAAERVAVPSGARSPELPGGSDVVS